MTKTYFEKVWNRGKELEKCKFLAELWIRGELTTSNLIKALNKYQKLDKK